MPSNVSGRRRVRCPKCTALLTEPQTQIYECPICATLLLAKGYGVGRSSDNRLHLSGSDAEDIQKIIDGGAKLGKASLMNSDQELLRGDSVESENNRDFEGENIPQPESYAPLNPSNQSLSGVKLSKHSSPKGAAVSSELSADTPHHGKSGEVSPSRGSGHQSSDVDSASHSESETYLDSPLWSSENVNANESAEVSSLVNSLEGSSFVNRSSEPVSTVTGLDCVKGLSEENDLGNDAKIDDRHQNTVLQQCMEVFADDKEVDHSYTTSLDGSQNGFTGITSSKTPPSGLLDKETSKEDSKDSQYNGNPKETANVGKFRLFDLSVFGIYNEETYNELRRGKVAHYASLTENGNEGESIPPPSENQSGSQISDGIAAQGVSAEKDGFGARSHENISHFQKNGVSESSVIDTEGICIGTGANGEMNVNTYREDTDTRNLDSLGREAENVGVSSLEEENSLPVGDRDNDALAKARYGDDLTLRELSSEAASVDISFGDWRSQQVPMSSHSALEPDPVADFVNENKVVNLATEEDTDSSWDDDEGLTFPSTAKGVPNLRATDPTKEDAPDSLSARESNDASQKNFTEKLAFPLRTTAMQKFLQRDDQQSADPAQSSQSLMKVQNFLQGNDQQSADPAQSSQSFMKAGSIPYEAPYVEHYSPLPGKGPQEASDQMGPMMPEQEECNVPPKKAEDPHAEALEDTEKETIELRSQSLLPSAHSSPASNMKDAGTLLTPEHLEEEHRRQVALAERAHSSKDAELVARTQKDGILGKMDHTVLEARMDTAALASEKSDSAAQWNANKLGKAAGMPVSLRWKGKGSSTQSVSSTEDEGAYGMESEAGSGPEKDPFREEAAGPIGRPFPDKEGIFGSGQQPRDPAGRGSQWTWISTFEANRQKHGSGELATSRRTARSRPLSERLSNQGPLAEAERLSLEEKSSDSETSRRTALGRPAEQFPAFLGPGLNLNRAELDQRSNYLYNGTADYNSDRSSRPQDVPSRSHYNDYMSNSYGSASGAMTRAYPFQLPPHGSIPLAASQEQGRSHPAHSHQCVSPSCSVCIQQQYFLQQSQMHQNTILHQCAACAAQISAAYQPMHHEMHGHHLHGHHIHGLTHSNPSLNHHDFEVLPAQARRQNRSSVQNNHPVLLARRMKHYPPLPGKGAPPFVLCRHCNQLLRVPEYLPPISGSVQKLHCSACGKTSKFSISQADNRAFWSTVTGVTVNASDLNDFGERDKQHTNIPSVYSSGQGSSSGVVSNAESLYGKARLISGQGSLHEWVENRASPHQSTYGTVLTQSDFVGPRNQRRAMVDTTGSGQEPYGGHVRGNRASNDTGLYSEDYFSSSPSSTSGASPGRHSQMSRDNQRVPRVMGRAPGDQKFSPDFPAQMILHEQGRFPLEAASISDGLFQKGVSENRSRVSGTSLQGSVHDPIGDSPWYAGVERFDISSKGRSWQNDLADADYSGTSTPRSRIEQVRKLPVAPGSPLIEHFTQDATNEIPSGQHRHVLQSSGNGSRSSPWSPKSGSQFSPPNDPYSEDALADVGERLYDDDRLQLPFQDGNKGPKSFAGLLKRSIKDLGKGGQGGGNRRKVVVNGYLIPETAVRKAEERAGPIHSGTYWYDYQAGFWGVMGGPCLGILMPFIEGFHFPLARDCASGKTGILVNGRELHDKDLEVLARRGLPTNSGKAYILDISGALFDDASGQPLKGLGKLAPSIEKRGRGFGMSPSTAQS